MSITTTPAAFAPSISPSERILELTLGELRQSSPMIIEESVYAEIRHSLGTRLPETGGMLGGPRYSSVIEHFFLDDSGATTAVTYYPDMAKVNEVLREEWNPEHINLLGFAHSHPGGHTTPSSNDQQYSARILTHIPEMGRMLLPIVQSVADNGTFEIRPWVVERSGTGFETRLTTLEIKRRRPSQNLADFEEYARVTDAYDLHAMSESRVIAIGCGGSAQFLEDLARTGVSEFVLVDPDVIERPNVGTQQVSISDVGRPKVAALADRIVNASPHARVLMVQASSDDLTDEMFARLVNTPLPGSTYHVPRAKLLCAFTDSFEAQARLARVGLHLRVPVISATVYREGRGAELTFAAAGVTSACTRCALSSRYRQVLDEGYRNDVTSHGTPLWATARLNAAKTPLALALLHRAAGDPAHPATARYARMLDQIAERNLVLLGLDTDIRENLGIDLFERLADPSAGVLQGDLTLWRRPTPDTAESGGACPDCGGTGDLDDSQGRFAATQNMPRTFGDYRFPGTATAPGSPAQLVRASWWRRLRHGW